jgi:hypothetical protein
MISQKSHDTVPLNGNIKGDGREGEHKVGRLGEGGGWRGRGGWGKRKVSG